MSSTDREDSAGLPTPFGRLSRAAKIADGSRLARTGTLEER